VSQILASGQQKDKNGKNRQTCHVHYVIDHSGDSVDGECLEVPVRSGRSDGNGFARQLGFEGREKPEVGDAIAGLADGNTSNENIRCLFGVEQDD
jgi:hypothetical protein